ncbi:hypothetical protein [Niameybacter massiliensis]|uniref:hypothetical protein n=1 Tax=Niameybacter massiliensis TaxID=1658108 RepID=UPI0006B42D12|nr:hypothetical protein [Niameybacter massiliensis]
MKATELQQQIAKELCLKMLEKGEYAEFYRGDLDEISYNTQTGHNIGTLYQAILSKVCATETI